MVLRHFNFSYNSNPTTTTTTTLTHTQTHFLIMTLLPPLLFLHQRDIRKLQHIIKTCRNNNVKNLIDWLCVVKATKHTSAFLSEERPINNAKVFQNMSHYINCCWFVKG